MANNLLVSLFEDKATFRLDIAFQRHMLAPLRPERRPKIGLGIHRARIAPSTRTPSTA